MQQERYTDFGKALNVGDMFTQNTRMDMLNSAWQNGVITPQDVLDASHEPLIAQRVLKKIGAPLLDETCVKRADGSIVYSKEKNKIQYHDVETGMFFQIKRDYFDIYLNGHIECDDYKRLEALRDEERVEMESVYRTKTMIFCAECGKWVDKDSSYCIFCGSKLI